MICKGFFWGKLYFNSLHPLMALHPTRNCYSECILNGNGAFLQGNARRRKFLRHAGWFNLNVLEVIRDLLKMW